jgi:ribosomal protein S18 acetylase RimI-like enzyme
MSEESVLEEISIVGESEATMQVWKQSAHLVIDGVPNSVISHLGLDFNIRFYKAIAESVVSCAFFAIGESGKVEGMIIGTLDKDHTYYRSIREHPITMAIAANFRLLSPAVLKWIFTGFSKRHGHNSVAVIADSKAELIVIAVNKDYRGSNVARSLVLAMERKLADLGGVDGYNIFTEEANIRANRFYEKVGATLIDTSVFHGRRINRWFKAFAHD